MISLFGALTHEAPRCSARGFRAGVHGSLEVRAAEKECPSRIVRKRASTWPGCIVARGSERGAWGRRDMVSAMSRDAHASRSDSRQGCRTTANVECRRF